MHNPFVVITGLALALGVHAATPTTTANPAAAQKTAESQSTAAKDVETTRLIREKITDMDNLSVRAQNIKIITENGRVILKGPVASKEEMETVGRIARQNAGSAKVINETYVER